MGLCRDDFGKVSVESRRESFYIHHDYEPGDGSLWADVPHPELGYEDLDDLIAALTDLRENDKQYQKWQREHPVEDCPVCGGTCGREGCHFC